MRIAINGFGRMGRLGMRAGWDRPELAFTRVNEIATDAAGSAHLLKFDSVHGVWDRETGADTGGMLVDGERRRQLHRAGHRHRHRRDQNPFSAAATSTM